MKDCKSYQELSVVGYGFQASFEFFALAFSQTFGPEERIGLRALFSEGSLRLASALLGGQVGSSWLFTAPGRMARAKRVCCPRCTASRQRCTGSWQRW